MIISTVNEYTVNVSAVATYDIGYSAEGLKTQIEDAIEEYMLSLRKTWVHTTSIIVRRAAIENAIYNIDGITDVTNVLINGGTENITLQENVIPIKGAVSCS